MPTINQLATADVLVGADQVPIYSSENGDARKTSLNAIKEFVNTPDDGIEGILAISSLFVLRKTTPVTIAVGTSFQNIDNYDSSPFIVPSGRTSLSPSAVIGEMVATRDIAAVQFHVALNGTWPTNRDLTLGILLGSDANPFESSFGFVGAGRGANTVSASFSGISANLNNGGNVIRAGEKIRLVAKFNTADNLTLNKVAFEVQPLDGI